MFTKDPRGTVSLSSLAQLSLGLSVNCLQVWCLPRLYGTSIGQVFYQLEKIRHQKTFHENSTKPIFRIIDVSWTFDF
jgi:hypothetical protein